MSRRYIALIICAYLFIISCLIMFILTDKPIGTRQEVVRNYILCLMSATINICSVLAIMYILIRLILQKKGTLIELISVIIGGALWIYMVASSIYSLTKRFGF